MPKQPSLCQTTRSSRKKGESGQIPFVSLCHAWRKRKLACGEDPEREEMPSQPPDASATPAKGTDMSDEAIMMASTTELADVASPSHFQE